MPVSVDGLISQATTGGRYWPRVPRHTWASSPTRGHVVNMDAWALGLSGDRWMPGEDAAAPVGAASAPRGSHYTQGRERPQSSAHPNLIHGALDGGGGGTTMSHVAFKNWQCRMSLSLRIPLVPCQI